MKTIKSISLYIIYLAIVLVKPVLIHYANKTFNSFLIFIISVVVPVICILIILARTHLVEYSYTRRDLLFNASFIALSIFLIIWLHGMVDISLLVPILTEDVYDFIVRVVKRIRK